VNPGVYVSMKDDACTVEDWFNSLYKLFVISLVMSRTWIPR
jgi:hypothetical protein